MEVLILILMIISGNLGRIIYRYFRRRNLLAKPFPQEWVQILESNLELYRYLPDGLKRELHQKINVFIGEKVFKGCGGLKINDEIKVTIAGQACILLLNRKSKFYPKCKSIYVYPEAYVHTEKVQKGVIVSEEKQVRLGESWNYGPVVLAWDDTIKGAKRFDDGRNVVFHEFAHQLDQEDGGAEGYPKLDSRSQYLLWGERLGEGFQELRKKISKNKATPLRHYAATNPAEYFAVATEAFFEQPQILATKLPDVYQSLQDFYQIDPKLLQGHGNG